MTMGARLRQYSRNTLDGRDRDSLYAGATAGSGIIAVRQHLRGCGSVEEYACCIQIVYIFQTDHKRTNLLSTMVNHSGLMGLVDLVVS